MTANTARAVEAPDLTAAARAAAAGDPKAFAVLVSATRDRLFRLACRVVGDADDGADILQDAYLRAFASLRRGEFDGRALIDTWLYRVALSVALNARRARLRGQARAAAAPRPSVDALEQAQARLHLREAFEWMRELPDEQCAAMVLRGLEGLSTKETAEVLGCSEGAVEQRLVRARETLRRRSEQ